MPIDDLPERLRAFADELDQLGRAPADPLRSIERAMVTDEVSSLVRHDLRNRLGVIRNAAFYLKRRVQTHDAWSQDPRVSEFFGLIEDSVVASIATIEGRLDPARFASRRRVVSGRACVERAAACVVAAPGRLEITAGPGDVRVDPEEITLALRCLFENALEAGDGPVTVSANRQDDAFVVMVSDEGPGVPAAAREVIFEPFHSTKEGRAGLGLNLARRAARRHGGGVALRPSEVGACFVLELPLAAGRDLAGES